MFKLYRTSQELQYTWIRKHPVQYVVLNVALTAMWIGYIEYKERKELRQIKKDIALKTD